MNQVGEFEKVSMKRFLEDIKSTFGARFSDVEIESMYHNLKLPARATAGSAGYDFVSPITLKLIPGTSAKIPTGIRVKIDEGWWLGCLPRSSLGFKYRMQFDNTMGVIDADYRFSDNEGHIFAKITNDGDKDLIIAAGDRFMQGIFIPHGITYGDSAGGVRNGGMGSTGR